VARPSVTSASASADGRMAESFESRMWRWGGNLFPAYRRSGARITYVAADFHEVHIKIPSNWKTRNHMGITWGGGLYSALDPIYGVMLYKLLAGKYRVVDRTASIHFKRPARATLYARFQLTTQELKAIKTDLQAKAKLTRHYTVDLLDQYGVVHACCEKELCIQTL